MRMWRRRPSPGRLVLWVLFLGALAISARRFAFGLGSVTHLSNRFPWGLWVAVDVLGGVALAAGGFTMAAAVYVLHNERYRPLVRPAVVTGFLGYVLVIAALLVDLGRPYRIWHPVIMWNPHSVMFEVAWCVLLYTLVLALEFGQMVLERLGRLTMLRLTRLAMPPLVVAGVILSMLHQSSLGTLFLIVPGKLHPLWYTPLLPVFFFVSALAVGPAMVLVESFLSSRALKRELELPLLRDLARISFVILSIYLGLKVTDLTARGAWTHALTPSVEGRLFAAELLLGVVIPLVLLATNGGPGASRHVLAATLVVLGVLLNRLNVAITGMLAGSHATYVPAWTEVVVTLGITSAGILAYLWVAEHLPVFPQRKHATL
ncbi:MAG: Ni/Fe-hydrogenase cytochrome b subunit [Armatimonadota bacterium]|nr:Ni/Fe-hydrogenase cytochrome b subunit [Armatimonadota bacterium]MDR7426659.1 Ni/Fe-hydrogenase cytochrome b subunit [Armatimonadota bacterium]MDR7473802.1 Ni/Fe-hydrogenase cytochrome b subunit [Armatimonadota bacterium]